MQWNELVGHQRQKEWFDRAVQRGRLANTFLFLGPDGVGKRTFARLLAKSLLCHRSPSGKLEPCGACEDCAQVNAMTHPDLIEVAKPSDKSVIPLELIIGPEEARRSEGLIHDIGLKPYSGKRKIAILDDADSLAAEGANALLKTLEEPPPDSLLILMSVSLQKQLPTIRSRCQVIRFQPLAVDQLAQLIVQQGIVTAPEQSLTIARQCDGGLGMARTLADESLAKFRSQLLEVLANEQLDFVSLAKTVGEVTDSAGKESIVRRPRIKLMMKMAADFYRELALQLQGAEPSSDASLQQAISRRMQRWEGGVPAAMDCWSRCLEAISEVDRNANQTALLEDWSANLASLGSS